MHQTQQPNTPQIKKTLASTKMHTYKYSLQADLTPSSRLA